jgi:hypothetical protein
MLFSSSFAKCAIHHQVIEPEPVNVYVLNPPETDTLGEPVVDTAAA